MLLHQTYPCSHNIQGAQIPTGYRAHHFLTLSQDLTGHNQPHSQSTNRRGVLTGHWYVFGKFLGCFILFAPHFI